MVRIAMAFALMCLAACTTETPASSPPFEDATPSEDFTANGMEDNWILDPPDYDNGIGADATSEVAVERSIGTCGYVDSAPYYIGYDTDRRECAAPSPRAYRPKYNGIAKQALDIETQACFVPDASYRLLDEIVDVVLARTASRVGTQSDLTLREQMLLVSEITGEVLVEKGFRLRVPTRTLGDALHYRDEHLGEETHVIDCDNSALILLEIAEALDFKASFVDMTYPSGYGHNYVRWHLDETKFFDWDTNGRQECRTEKMIRPYDGIAFSRNETLSYLTTLRAFYWSHKNEYALELADYKRAIELDASRPDAFNHAAWLIATKEFEGRAADAMFAIEAAQTAVGLFESAGYLDTLACAHAFNGDFPKAIAAQEKAVALDPDNTEFRERLEMFKTTPSRDCTGFE